MPSVFTDAVGDYDLSIMTAADWTVVAVGLPNGDNYVTGDGSIDPTYNLNGIDFPLAVGDWTIEFWIYFDATAGDRTIVFVGNPGTTADFLVSWYVFLNSAEAVGLVLVNNAGAAYSQRISATGLATATWHYVVFTKTTGAAPICYLNTATSSSTSTTATGTPAALVAQRLYFGTASDSTNDLTSGLRIAKFAIYDRILTSGEMNTHYLAMTT